MTRPYHLQITSAVANLEQGLVAELELPDFPVTYYLREIARDRGWGPSPWVLYATWFRDNRTGGLHPGQVLRFSVNAEHLAATTAYDLLERLPDE